MDKMLAELHERLNEAYDQEKDNYDKREFVFKYVGDYYDIHGIDGGVVCIIRDVRLNEKDQIVVEIGP